MARSWENKADVGQKLYMSSIHTYIQISPEGKIFLMELTVPWEGGLSRGTQEESLEMSTSCSGL